MAYRPHPAYYLFLYSLQNKNDFYIYKWLGEKNQKKDDISWHINIIWNSDFSNYN